MAEQQKPTQKAAVTRIFLADPQLGDLCDTCGKPLVKHEPTGQPSCPNCGYIYLPSQDSEKAQSPCYLDLRAYLGANPYYLDLLRSRLDPEDARDVDRIEEYARRVFIQSNFTAAIFPQLDRFLRLRSDPGMDIYYISLREVADWLEEAAVSPTKVTEPIRKNKPRKRRGRKPDTDPKYDKQVSDAWQTRRYRRYEDLAKELGTTKNEVKWALDRYRHRPQE